MPKRKPIENYATFNLSGNDYRIIRLISDEGASSLVYLAERLPDKLNLSTKVVLKEFYPKDSVKYCVRSADGIGLEFCNMSAAKTKTYEMLKAKFCEGIYKQVVYSEDDCLNHSFGASQIVEINSTVCAMTEWVGDFSFSRIDRTKLTLCEIAQIMVSLCNAVKCLHVRGQLHLDIKPSNIFLFPKQEHESRRIALFDFDSVVTNKHNLPLTGVFSPGWSAPEQEMWNTNTITEAADVYAVGAFFYWLLTGEMATNEITTNISDKKFLFLAKAKINPTWEDALGDVRSILNCTLVKKTDARIKDLREIVEMANNLNKNADPNIPGVERIKEMGKKLDDVANAVSNNEKTNLVFNSGDFRVEKNEVKGDAMFVKEIVIKEGGFHFGGKKQ